MAVGSGEALEQLSYAVGAGEADQVVRGEVERRGLEARRPIRERLDADHRGLHHLGAQLSQPPGEPAGLGSRASDRHGAPAQRQRRAPRELGGERGDGAHHGDRGGSDSSTRASSAIVASVPVTVRWWGSVPRSTIAAGSEAGRPASIREAAMCGSWRTPIKRRVSPGRLRAPANRGPSPPPPRHLMPPAYPQHLRPQHLPHPGPRHPPLRWRHPPVCAR